MIVNRYSGLGLVCWVRKELFVGGEISIGLRAQRYTACVSRHNDLD